MTLAAKQVVAKIWNKEIAMAKNNTPRTMPNNLEAEQAVLCSALIDNLASETIMSKLDARDFYSETHKIIFDTMKTLYLANKPVDFVTVVDALEKHDNLEKVGGISYITSLSNVVPSSAYHNHYTEIVKRDSILRQLIETCSNIATKAYEADSTEVLAEAEKALYEIGEKGSTGGLESMRPIFTEAMSTFEDICKNGNNTHGVRTGFIALDKKMGGLQKTDLIILAARPGIGKTSLAMNIVSNAAIEDNARCAIFSLEMGKEQLAQRMLCSVAGVNMAKIRGGEQPNEADWAKLWNAHKKLQNSQIYVDDNSLNKPSQILAKCRKLKRERGLDLVVVDYLQLMTGDTKTDSRQTEVSEMSRQMKILAKEIDVPVIVLSQLSRAVLQRQDHKPMLSDLRESGSIEQDADIVIFIDRKEESNDETIKNTNYVADLIIAKFRNGEPGTVKVGWDGGKVSFVNLSSDENDKSLERAYEAMHSKPQAVSDDADVFADLPTSEIPPEYFGAGDMDGFAPQDYGMPQEMPPVDDVFDN
jgi:replicative DNA helicase